MNSICYNGAFAAYHVVRGDKLVIECWLRRVLEFELYLNQGLAKVIFHLNGTAACQVEEMSVCYFGEQMVGWCVRGKFSNTKNEGMVYVHPNYRGKGICGYLVRMLHWSKDDPGKA